MCCPLRMLSGSREGGAAISRLFWGSEECPRSVFQPRKEMYVIVCRASSNTQEINVVFDSLQRYLVIDRSSDVS